MASLISSSYSSSLLSSSSEHSSPSSSSSSQSTSGIPSLRFIFLFCPLLFWLFRLARAGMAAKGTSCGKILGEYLHGKVWVVKNKEKLDKFGEFTYKLSYHALITIAGLLLLYRESFIWNTVEIWETWSCSPSSSLSSSMYGNEWEQQSFVKAYYFVQCLYNAEAFYHLIQHSFELLINDSGPSSSSSSSSMQKYISSSWSDVTIRFSPSCRGDFREMMFHHLTASSLIILSAHYRLFKVGSMVMVIHDISDLSVDCTKLSNFIKWRKATIISYCSMIISWLVFRLGAFPFVVISSCAFEAPVLAKNECVADIFLMFHSIFVTLLCFLLFLHVFWFVQIVRIGILIVLKKEYDVSQYKNGNKEEEEDTACESDSSCSSNCRSKINNISVTTAKVKKRK
jgi:hypothetical protein